MGKKGGKLGGLFSLFGKKKNIFGGGGGKKPTYGSTGGGGGFDLGGKKSIIKGVVGAKAAILGGIVGVKKSIIKLPLSILGKIKGKLLQLGGGILSAKGA